MLSGMVFRLFRRTMCIDSTGSKPVAVEIPEGAVVHLHAPSEVCDRMVDITFHGHVLTMFEVDLRERAEHIGTAIRPEWEDTVPPHSVMDEKKSPTPATQAPRLQ